VALTRTRLTWLMYAATAAWASFVYLLGPSTPLLAEDFSLDPQQAGLYGTALAVGIVSGGLVSGRLTSRLGRPATFRMGLLLLGAGVAVLFGAPTYPVSLLAVWLAGMGGALVLNSSTATLSDLHGADSAAAITEANAIAAWIGAVSPLVLGAVLAAGVGWRGAVAVCLVLALAAFVVSLRGAGTTPTASHDRPRPVAVGRGLRTRQFVVTCVALFAAVGSEFAVNFWGATVLREVTSDARATSAMSAVVIGLAIGRTVGAWVSTRVDTHPLMVGGFATAGAGFAVFWTSSGLATAVVGLLLVGLGLSTLFPFVLDRVVANAGGQADRGLAVGSLVLGSAIAVAPFALGALAAVMPVRQAFLLVPALLAAGLLAVLASRPEHAPARADAPDDVSDSPAPPR
jgi:MFS family permease